MREFHATSTNGAGETDHGITLETITTGDDEFESAASRRRWQPERLFRTCVATLQSVHGFGPLVAAEAQKRGFYQAGRKVFLGDGQEANWTVHSIFRTLRR